MPDADAALDRISCRLGCDGRRELVPGCWALSSRSTNRFVVKRRSASFTQCESAFRLLEGAVDPDGLVNKPFELGLEDGYYYIIDNFIRGRADIEANRPLMPSVFARLARFHMANRRNAPVSSMYSDGAAFPSARAMLEAEFAYHESFWDLGQRVDECLARVLELDAGFTAVLHGDAHTGNMVAGDAGPVLVDTEWSLVGLNLFEFEHVDLLDIGRDYPERIRREARACCRSYFGELGVGMRRAAELMSALGVLKVIRQHTYVVYKKDDAALAAIPAALDAALTGISLR